MAVVLVLGASVLALSGLWGFGPLGGDQALTPLDPVSLVAGGVLLAAALGTALLHRQRLTALLLLIRIETAFNRIWRVAKGRTLLNRVVMYWAVLTLGPLALGAAAARVVLLEQDVRSVTEPPADVACAFNFSYFGFHDRATLLEYFRSVGLSGPFWGLE